MLHRRGFLSSLAAPALAAPGKRPNILIALADDQSHIHSAAYGCRGLKTPASDRISREGVRFTNALSSGAMCTVSRAALLTGRNIWQNREAGTHWSNFPRDLTVFPDLLERAGYHIGYTGAGWKPGDFRSTGWPRNPAGPEYNQITLPRKPFTGVSEIDYAANFAAFLKKKGPDQPFYFWFGSSEPHDPREQDAGVRAGRKLESVDVPPNFPRGTPEVRSWLLDYFVEIEWMDQHLGRILKTLEHAGELDNTLVVVSGDNGSAMPRAKGNLYDWGTHVPLLMRWPGRIRPGRVVDDLVAFVDLAPTFLDAAGLKPPAEMAGRSLLPTLFDGRSGRVDPTREYAVTGHERGSHDRVDNLGCPMRGIRDYRYQYIWNLKPDRWPIGDPKHFPNLRDRDDARKRPPEELYDLDADPACLRNLAADPARAADRKRLRAELEKTLQMQGDLRMLGSGDIWESYPRFGPFKPQIEGFNKRGEYNPAFQVKPKGK